MFGGNDLKMALRYSVKVGQFKHWFIDFNIMAHNEGKIVFEML